MTGPAVRGYGYRLRDDARPELGVPAPTGQGTPGDVADAIARAGSSSTSGPTYTSSIAKASTGLVFRDRFDRADGGLGADWTTITGTWAILTLLARGTPAVGPIAENVVASVLAAAAERVVQSYLRVSAVAATAAIRARWDGGTEAAGNGYLLELVAGTGWNLKKQVAGAYTTIAAIANAALAAGVLYGAKLHVKNSAQKAYADGALLAIGADVAHDALNGKAGIRSSNSGAAGPTIDADDFAVYLSNTVTVNALPAGYQVRINGTLYSSAAGTALCDLAGAMCPLQSIEVLDAAFNVLATLVPADGIWGGDVYTFNPVSAPQSVRAAGISETTIRVEWNTIADAQTYRVEWHGGNGAWATLADVDSSLLVKDHTGLTEGVTRFYRVTAIKDGGLGPVSSTTSATTLPAAPNDFRISSAAPGSVVLLWTDRSAKEVNYQLQRRTGVAAFADIGALLAANTATATDLTATAGNTYTYRVVAIDVLGQRSYSNEISAAIAALGAISRTTSGLLFRDDFNRADGAPGANWIVESGTWAIASNKLTTLIETNLTRKIRLAATAFSARAKMLIQAMIARPETRSFLGLTGRNDGTSYYPYYHAASDSGGGQANSSNMGRVAPAVNVNVGFSAGPAAVAGVAERLTLFTDVAIQKGWIDGGSIIATTDASAANAVNGVAGMTTFGQPAAGNSTATIDDYIVCSDKVVTLNGLAAGYKLRVGGIASAAAAGGGAPVTVDIAATLLPIAAGIEILDPSGNVAATYAPSDGTWGGDVYQLGAPTVPPVSVNVGIGPGGVYDGVTIAFAPYYTGTLFTGRTVLNSKPSIGGRADTSQSLPIDITFDVAVKSVTITCFDPTLAGDDMIAYDVGGVEIGRVNFPFSGGNAGVTRTVTVDGIRKITLSPAIGDFIAFYDMKFTH